MFYNQEFRILNSKLAHLCPVHFRGIIIRFLIIVIYKKVATRRMIKILFVSQGQREHTKIVQEKNNTNLEVFFFHYSLAFLFARFVFAHL